MGVVLIFVFRVGMGCRTLAPLVRASTPLLTLRKNMKFRSHVEGVYHPKSELLQHLKVGVPHEAADERTIAEVMFCGALIWTYTAKRIAPHPQVAATILSASQPPSVAKRTRTRCGDGPY